MVPLPCAVSKTEGAFAVFARENFPLNFGNWNSVHGFNTAPHDATDAKRLGAEVFFGFVGHGFVWESVTDDTAALGLFVRDAQRGQHTPDRAAPFVGIVAPDSTGSAGNLLAGDFHRRRLETAARGRRFTARAITANRWGDFIYSSLLGFSQGKREPDRATAIAMNTRPVIMRPTIATAACGQVAMCSSWAGSDIVEGAPTPAPQCPSRGTRYPASTLSVLVFQRPDGGAGAKG